MSYLSYMRNSRLIRCSGTYTGIEEVSHIIRWSICLSNYECSFFKCIKIIKISSEECSYFYFFRFYFFFEFFSVSRCYYFFISNNYFPIITYYIIECNSSYCCFSIIFYGMFYLSKWSYEKSKSIYFCI